MISDIEILINLKGSCKDKYCSLNASIISFGWTSPFFSEIFCTTSANSCCIDLGNLNPKQWSITNATPPLPDWLLILTNGSYSLPRSLGSTGKYGTCHIFEPLSSYFFIPLFIASWCEPENAVNTKFPA